MTHGSVSLPQETSVDFMYGPSGLLMRRRATLPHFTNVEQDVPRSGIAKVRSAAGKRHGPRVLSSRDDEPSLTGRFRIVCRSREGAAVRRTRRSDLPPSLAGTLSVRLVPRGAPSREGAKVEALAIRRRTTYSGRAADSRRGTGTSWTLEPVRCRPELLAESVSRACGPCSVYRQLVDDGIAAPSAREL